MYINSFLPLLMKEHKIVNVTELSVRTGIPVSKLSEFVTGTEKMDLEIAEQLTNFFGCRIKDILDISSEKHDYSKHINTGEQGIIYFLKADNNLTKIGWTTNLKKRKETLDYTEKVKTELIYFIPTQDCRGLEKLIHTIFADKRVKGEWFDIKDEDINIFKPKVIDE